MQEGRQLLGGECDPLTRLARLQVIVALAGLASPSATPAQGGIDLAVAEGDGAGEHGTRALQHARRDLA
ncbi:MAG: hypothetical protein KDK91_30755, partial [Gammaproteobacteria bacterium]|nr:hypothetical protein [Gammaproteobacteria bacterium]